ncbi:hypothetical protein B0T16DRAFT_110220 [Cercophora newfieldiana]|uniref:Uncharacterized protein n=1 Tax=Cercophora newfieldiana TaxID=92897 RepID=A0AA39YI28_9PEZI|nr:hypothetical protein B0T16DRAFT_110220 [Cercophora newfieldiana]
MGLNEKEKVEVTVVTAELEPADSILPASPDIAKRTRTFTFPVLLRAQSWRTWRDTAREDLKSMEWLVALRWTAMALWAYGLVFALASLSSLAADHLDTPDFISHFLDIFGLRSKLWFLSAQKTACQPNGNFSMYPYTYRWWSMADFFEITMGFKSLSFTQAKVVDIVSGMVLGRLAQALAGYVSWRVFADYLTTSMAAKPATYTTFWVVFLHREPSLAAGLRLLREFFRGGALNSKVAMAFMSWTFLFVLSIPTLANSMTGYGPVSAAFIRTPDIKHDSNSSDNAQPSNWLSLRSSLTRFYNFRETMYLIHDGARVGLTNDFPISFPLQMVHFAGSSGHSAFEYSDGEPLLNMGDRNWECKPCIASQKGDIDCMRANVSSYVQTYGFNGVSGDVSSTFMGIELPAPVLNISVMFIPGNRIYGSGKSLRSGKSWYDLWEPNSSFPDECFGRDWTDPRTGEKPAQDRRNRYYQDPLDRAYSLDVIEGVGTCQPVAVRCEGSDDDLCTIQQYLWGFSYVQLFLNLLLYFIWTIGLYIMWLKSAVQLPLKGSPEVPRGWRALIHLGETIRRDLDRRGIDPDKLTDRQLKTEIRKQLHGGSVTFDKMLKAPGFGFWRTFQSWRRRGGNRRFFQWSMATAGTAVLFNILGWAIKDYQFGLVAVVAGYVLSFAFMGLLWSMALGNNTTSKTMFIVAWSVFAPAVWFGFRLIPFWAL